MEINIKDIIKPKFAKGQDVFVRQGNGSVKKAKIQQWEVVVNSDKPVEAKYYVGDSNWWPESSVFATAAEAFGEK